MKLIYKGQMTKCLTKLWQNAVKIMSLWLKFTVGLQEICANLKPSPIYQENNEGLQKPENKAQEVSAANPQLEACGAVYIKQTVRKVMHKNRHSVHFYVVEQTVCKRSAHDVTLKTEVILCLLHDAQIRTN